MAGGSTAGDQGLEHVVRLQLGALSEWAGLSAGNRTRLTGVYRSLTCESLDRLASPPFEGLSYINADGLPFQWVLRFSADGSGFGFVTETGAPGTPPQLRLNQSLERLELVCGGAKPAWLAEMMANVLPAEPAQWPAHWRSAMWTGVAASREGVLLKPYFNMNRDSARDRWLRAGRVLAALQRHRSLERLCLFSRAASKYSWPVGLAADVLPNGGAGRVKVYFRSGPVQPHWLETWYRAAGLESHSALVRRLLDLFPFTGRHPYPNGAFIVSVEFHVRDGDVSIKTDVGVTKWISSDQRLVDGARCMIQETGGDPDALNSALRALGCQSFDQNHASLVRFVGLGSEPDGACHVNVYLEPPLRPVFRRKRLGRSRRAVLDAGVRFLLASQRQSHWTDYCLPVGESDTWVTAYVLARLSELHFAPNLSLADSLDWLESARTPGGGWGFNQGVENDADSTAWAILALRRLGRAVPSDAISFLRRALQSSGAFATYPAGGSAYGGWVRSAPDVTAVARRALGLNQDPAPPAPPPAYWWASPLYTLSAILDGGLLTTSIAGLKDRLARRAVENAFEQALLLRCISQLRSADVARETTRLVEMQQADGSWPASAHLRLTRPEVTEPWKAIDAGPLFLDNRAIFTSATALSALASSDDTKNGSV